ncbi:hypothetical protein EHV15_36035 [Paenibacillus oralis]|uniref:Uncharacterized protein n=1 Tax=Paenibacillus oralis TaxID=2490856 RepID=A0A3P3TAA1_9BACL|nr:hypothetical protein [Paenibacillus oralis]RRJ54981.1 hypothetical protein EHV15_36035 [Paenibacillus oralis]
MSENDAHIANNNIKKIEMITELVDLLTSREPIDYSQFDPSINPRVSIEEIARQNERKEIEVKTLQNAWEQLESLLFNDLQITFQEKNQLFTYLGNKRKEEKQKHKSRNRSKTQVWRADQ